MMSRASRILQKVTGRIRLYPNRKAAQTANDDIHPYPSQAASRSSIGAFKPYMSHPMLSSTVVEPYAPGNDQDSSSQSNSPSGSLFRRSGDHSAPATPTSFSDITTTTKAIDGLPPISASHGASLVWTSSDTLKAHARPPRPTRPPPEAPGFTKHRPSTPISDPPAILASEKPMERSVEKSTTNMKQTKVETPSTFSPAQLFTRNASRPNLKDSDSETPPPVPSKHRQTPSIVIDPPRDALPPSPPLPGAKRPKIARIDTGLAPMRLFTRKPSRAQLQEPNATRSSNDPPTPHAKGLRHTNRPPSPTPAVPKPFSTGSIAPTPSNLASSSSTSSTSSGSVSSYHTSFSTNTNNTTPASTSASTPPMAPKLTTAASTSAMPTTTTLPPILQRSETAPHSYRLSLQMSTTGLRAPLNLPTLPTTPISPRSPPRRTKAGLRDMPELSHGGRREEPDDDDDDDVDINVEDEDEEGRTSRSSGRTTPYPDEGDSGYRHRPSFSSSISVNTSSSSLGTGHSHGKTHSRSSSYNHSHDYSRSQDNSIDGSSSFGSSDFLLLPGPDTSRLDLNFEFSFLDRPTSPPASSKSQPDHERKGKARARSEDEEGESGGKTPTSGVPNPYGSGGDSYDEKNQVSVRKESLKVWTGSDLLGAGKGKGKWKEREMDTAKPLPRPSPLQASVSMGEYGGIGVALGGGTGAGFYASKRASRSLVDLGAMERREKVEEIVRTEEVKMERRRSRMTRVEGNIGLGLSAGADAGVAEEVLKHEEVKQVEELRDLEMIRSQPRKDLATLKGTTIEASSPGMATPLASTSNRLSMAPAYETVVRRTSQMIRRRRSMPTFNENTEPPPYPSFPPLSPTNIHNASPFGLHNHNSRQAGMSIEPRDDEGKERLPSYTNDIYMRAILPRKMEFVSAGVQAKDRKWRRVVCVLEGTVLKVYQPPRERGKAALGDWWERKVGVGNKTVPYTPPVKGKKPGETALELRETVPKLVGEGGDSAGQTELVLRRPPTPTTPITPARAHPVLTGEHPYVSGQGSIYGNPQPQANRSRLNLAVSSLLRPSSSKSHSRTNSDATHPNLSVNSNNSPRPSLNIPRPRNSSSAGHGGRSSFSSARPGTPSDYSHSLGVPSSASSIHSQTSSVSSANALDDPRDLLRAYTMQNAESGLGNDYIKRKNVIRVRSEGEQFLLQAKDVEDVVAWIEVLQASANIALDLDERLMPKGPIFPRRRRRRPRVAATSTGTATRGTGTSNTSTTTIATQNTSVNLAQSSPTTVALP
ncbi:hypothetical protein H0H87_006833 [Tephrocybe sp. NHM501043]|nr:hypothetical protein H0H87_006833 [Tephrocybe sp. NHM501043]